MVARELTTPKTGVASLPILLTRGNACIQPYGKERRIFGRVPMRPNDLEQQVRRIGVVAGIPLFEEPDAVDGPAESKQKKAMSCGASDRYMVH
jgi:hypothetical protein